MRWNRTTHQMFGKIVLWCSMCLGLTNHMRQFTSAEEIQILESNASAIQTRLKLIQQSEREIALACYDADTGLVVNRLGAALADRAQNGVRVRLLVDGLASSQSYQQLYEISQRQVEVKVYHPIGTKRLDWLNRRLHSKIMVCDDDAMILGSRNLTDANFGFAGDNYVDADYLIQGDLSRCGREYFDWLWEYEGAVDIRQAIEGLAKPKATSGHNNDCHRSEKLFDIRQSEVTESLDRCIVRETVDQSLSVSSCNLTLFHDHNVAKNGFSIEAQVLKSIDAARSSLTIETPYPAFSHRFKSALIRAAKRGVRVRLLTNSIANSDQPTTVAALLNQKRALLRAGVGIQEFRGNGLFHAKSLIADQCVAWVGSYNFDSRGDRLNLELCMRVTDPRLAKFIEDGALRRNIRSQPVTFADLGRLDPEVPLKTRLQVRGFQLLMPALRPSL